MRKNCASKCIQKRSFNNKEEALKEFQFLKIDKAYKSLKGMYRCTLCGKYHLTKNDNAQFVFIRVKGKWSFMRSNSI